MLYRFAIVVLLILMQTWFAPSWSQSVILTGKIRNAFTQQAIPGVTVTLMRSDSTIIQDSLMAMALEGYTIWVKHDMPRVPQKLIVRVRHPEYDTAYLSYNLKNFGRNRQIDLPVIMMERKVSRDIALNAVVVRPTKIKMVQRGDTVVYDATAFNLPHGSMLDDLVRELPGAELKSNGEIYVNGKKVDYLMLNSREFFRGNNQVMLRNLPYYTVKDIKVYNRTTDLSAFIGREVENKEYVMDVQLKREYRQGYLGNAEAGCGTHDRYMGRAFALRFTDHSRLALYGGTNNTNNTSGPGGDGQWGTASDMNGEKKHSMAGGEFFWGNTTFSNGLKVMTRGTRTDEESRITAQSFLADGSTSFSRSQSMSDVKETCVDIYDYWKVTKKWWVSGDIAFRYNNRHDNASSDYASSLVGITLPDTLSYRSSQQYRDGNDKELSLSAEATRKLAWGDEVTFEAEYKHAYADHELFGKNMTSQRLQVPFVDYRHEYDRTKKKENYYSMKAKYVVPFLKGPAVSLMYNPVHKRIADCDNIFRLNRLDDWSVSANQPLRLLPSMADMMASCIDLGNTYNYKDVMTAHTLTLNVGQRKSTEKGTNRNVEFEFPLTLTHERMEYTRGLIDTIGSRDYTVLSPRISYESIWNDERYTFNASTSYLTSVANFVQLMPFRDDRNPLMVRENNPNLKRSWVYSAETSLSMRLRTYSQMLSFRASAEICGNQIANGFTFDPKTGVYTYRPENVNGNWNMSCYGNYSILFGKEQCFKFENNANAGFIHSVDIASVDGSAQATLSKVNTTVVKDETSFAFSKKDLRVEILGSVTHRHTVSSLDLFEPISAIDFNYGSVVRYTIPLLKVTAQTDLRMYSRRGYGSSEFNTDDLMWNATLSRAFMKGKLVVSADAVDILRNRDNMQYAVNAQGRTITWHRSMPSYAMLRVQWQFNYNPPKRR